MENERLRKRSRDRPQFAVPVYDGLIVDVSAETHFRDITKQSQRGDRGLPVRFLHTTGPPVGLISGCEVDSPLTPMLRCACNRVAFIKFYLTGKSLKK